MPFEIRLPALSAGMEDAIVSRWLRAEGDMVSKGDLIAEIETDKATMELEAEADGWISRLLISDGERAEVNQVIALLLRSGEDASGISTFLAGAASVSLTEPVGLIGATDDQARSQSSQLDGRPASSVVRHKASPLARRLACENDIPLEGVTGTGPKGRIVRANIEKAMSARVGAAAAVVLSEVGQGALNPQPRIVPVGIGAFEAVPHSSMRRTIARRLLEAKTTVPHFYLNLDCDLDALLALRGQINATRDSSSRISVNDFVIKYVGREHTDHLAKNLN
jgi:pyruvate dehydrogenase E2 component (dihydrolipoamide acetyltransferase)